MKRSLAWGPCLAALGLALAGCGDDGTTGPSGTDNPFASRASSPTATSSATPNTPTASPASPDATAFEVSDAGRCDSQQENMSLIEKTLTDPSATDADRLAVQKTSTPLLATAQLALDPDLNTKMSALGEAIRSWQGPDDTTGTALTLIALRKVQVSCQVIDARR